MNKKIIGILVCMLFIGITIPQIGFFDNVKANPVNMSMIVLNPIADTHLNHRSPDQNWGSDVQLEARNEYAVGGSSGWAWDSLINFDLSGIDSGSLVLSANLKLYYFNSLYNPQGRSIGLYRATSTWNEYSATWNNQPSYDSQISSSTNVPSSYSWMSWDVCSDVQDFIDGTKINFGWKLTDEGYWGSGNIPETNWCSREYSNSDFRPYLEININQPPNEPSVIYNKADDKIVIAATDPDGDYIRYGVSWDNDGMVDQYTGFVSSGTEQSIDCNDRTGTVGVIVEDEHGAQSDWVSVKSKNKVIDYPILRWFFEKFVQRFPFLKKY